MQFEFEIETINHDFTRSCLNGFYDRALFFLDFEELDFGETKNMMDVIFYMTMRNKKEILLKILQHVNFAKEKFGLIHEVQSHAISGNIYKIKEVIENQNDKSWTCIDFLCPLFIASSMGYFEIVKLLLENKEIDPNKIQKDIGTPFFMSCYNGHKEIVELYLKMDFVDYNIVIPGTSFHGYSLPFLAVCGRGHVDIFELMLKDDRIDKKSYRFDDTRFTITSCHFNNPPLMIACVENQLEIIKRLYELRESMNIDFNEVFSERCSAFSLSVSRRSLDVMKFLMGIEGLNLSMHNDEYKNNAIYYASCYGFHDQILMLLDHPKIEFIVYDSFKDEEVIEKLTKIILKNPERRSMIKDPTETLLIYYNHINILMNPEDNKREFERMRIEYGVADELAEELWLLTRIIEHGYYSINNDCDKNKKRFFKMVLVLPYELQMDIINKVYSLKKSFIKNNIVNPKKNI